jgi:hypothetical protein
MPTPSFADGSMQYGSQSTVIDGQSYTFKTIKVKRSRRRLVQPGVDAAPAQKVHIRGLTEGSGTVQLSSSTQVAPAQDKVFTLVPIGGGTPKNFITEDVEDAYEIEGETFCDITFSEKLSA